MSCLLTYFRDLNIFQSDNDIDEDLHQSRNNLIATRVYLILLISSLLGLTLGLSLTSQTTKNTLNYPSIDQIKILPLDAQCFCSHLSVSYRTFITLEASFHQVCSSDFITDRWIKAIYSYGNLTHFYQGDFRGSGSAQFQALAGLCRLSKNNVEDGLFSFYDTSLINTQLLFEDLLKTTIEVSIKQFNMTIPFAFQSQLNLINKLIFGNQLISGLRTTLDIFYINNKEPEVFRNYLLYKNYNVSQDVCLNDYNIGVSSGFYNVSGNHASNTNNDNETILLLYEIPGFFSGCMPMNSILRSTLECFYNQTCVNKILSYLSTNETFTAMNNIEQSLFPSKSTVQSIVNHIMVEQWISNISYEKYFAECAPLSCIYSKIERHDFLFVLTEIIGLLGGLALILGSLIPVLIQFIRKPKIKNSEPTPTVSLSIRFHQFKTYSKCLLIELNLFKSRLANDRHIRYQRIGTRCYILFLIISLTILIPYSSLMEDIQRETIFNPSESRYSELQEIYSNNLACPCTVLSIPHETFISIKPVYHQICSSDFISSNWINYLLQNEKLYFFMSNNNRTNLGTQFNMLSTLCKYSEQMANEALEVFYQTQFVSSQVIKEQIFRLQVHSLIQQWQLDTLNRCQRVIQLVRSTNQGNKFMNDFFNFKLKVNNISGQVNFVPINYSNCSCALYETCTVPMFIGMANDGSFFNPENITNDTFFIGCSALETLLQATLNCLYNRTCINNILSRVTGNIDGFELFANIPTLLITNQRSNETIESIVSRIMINSWSLNISFSSYYDACRPNTCTIEKVSRRQILVIFMIVISVLGGLSTGLKILTLIGIKFAENINENHSRYVLIQFIRNIFTCSNEQRIATRLHFILLVVMLFLFYLATFLPVQWKTVQITKPSLSIYQDLLTKFPEQIQCSCSQISFNYQTFLAIEPRFYQICSSNFITHEWIMYVYETNYLNSRLNYTDFRLTVVNQFQLLTSFCQLSQQTINESLLQLAATDYIDAQLVSSDMLNNRIQITIKEFQLRISKSFINTLNLLREVTGANKLMSGYSTNWKFDDIDMNTYSSPLYTASRVYQGCDCGLSSKCTQSSRGMMAGCYPLEALLQSTFQCFYHQQCIDASNTFKPLNSSSVISRFNINSTIEFILQELMVEEYFINMSYKNYFNQCAPSFCSYSYIGRRNVIDTIISLIGLYGGLVIISRWITALILELYKCRIRRIHTDIQ